MVSLKPQLWLFVMDRMQLLLLSAVTMVAAFSYSKIVNGAASDSSESLQRDPDPARNGVW
jgi:hypothetical protein